MSIKVSIIVCTRNRSYAITECLASIAASLAAAAPIEAEIVVVDNASTDDTSAVVRKWSETSAFPVQLLYEPKKGLSAARNCALRAAKGELLAFTDDDCRLSRDYVRDLLRHDAADTEPVLRGGRVELGDQTDLPVTILTTPVVKRWQKRLSSARYDNIGNDFLGCNMTMRKPVAESIGFFEEGFGAGSRIPAGEDTDYLYRAYINDILIEYVPDMVVYHFHGRKTASDGRKLFENYMIGQGAIYIKFLFKDYNLCRQFYWDFKDAMREIFCGKKDFRPEGIGFSYRLKIAFCLRGIARYWLTRKSP